MDLFYVKKGRGVPLIFLHGFCETSFIWEKFSDVFLGQFQVIIFDLPGFGKSSTPKGPFELTDIGDQITKKLMQIGIKQFHLVGHSLGAYIGLAMLNNYPERVKSLCIFNSNIYADSNEKKINRDRLIQFVDDYGTSSFVGSFIPSLFHPSNVQHLDETIERMKYDAKKVSPAIVQRYAAAMRDRQDYNSLVEKQKGRLILIAGENDQNTPLHMTLKMKELLGDDATYIFPNAAHMCMFEATEGAQEVLLEFFNKMEAAYHHV